MDNLDLPLIVAELLIDVQFLKERVALLEGTFAEVRDDLTGIRISTDQTHQEILDQGDRLRVVLAKVQAILAEQRGAAPAPAAAANAGAADAPEANAAADADADAATPTPPGA